MATQTVTAAISNIIEKRFTGGVRDALLDVNAAFKMIQTKLATKRDDVSQSWQATHTFITSVAGTLKATGSMGGDNFTEDNRSYRAHSAPSTFPTLVNAISPGYMQRTITLQEWMGNMFIPIEFARADQLSASIASAVAAVTKQTARMVAQMRANIFFTFDATNKWLAQGDGSTALTDGEGGALAAGDTSVLITVGIASRLRCLSPGMVVDLYDTTGATQRNATGTLVIDAVDPATWGVTIRFADGSTTWGTGGNSTPVNSDKICLGSSKGNGPKGPLYWGVSSGTIYGIDFSKFPQFKSLVKALGGALTPITLRQYITGFVSTRGPSLSPDTIMITEGGLNEYVYQMEGAGTSLVRVMLGPDGRPNAPAGGYAEVPPFTLNGKLFPFLPCDMLPAGHTWVLKLGEGNICRYVPPKVGKLGSDAQFQDIDFIAPWGGSPTIWKHYLYNSATTKFLEAPFLLNEEYAPEVLPFLRFTGCTEEIAYV